jgi:hypothetical protein
MPTRLALTAVTISVAVLFLSCQTRMLRHDQQVAATRAEAFLRHAVVERDFPSAYAMLREEDRQQTTQAAFVDIIKREHPKGYPTGVRATEYEPVLGQAAVQIFLVGENDGEKFYYRVPMVGTVDSGYSPNGLFRGPQPYPASGLRKPLK